MNSSIKLEAKKPGTLSPQPKASTACPVKTRKMFFPTRVYENDKDRSIHEYLDKEGLQVLDLKQEVLNQRINK
jgi:hypothetical protein